MRLSFPLVVGLLVVIGGCASPPATPGTKDTGAPIGTSSLGDGTTSAELGGLKGIVTDDELVPIPNATVALAQAGAQVLTDPGGRYEFQGVRPGSWTVLAERLGYESIAKKATVGAGEITTLDFVLKPIAVVEPYAAVIPRTLLVHVGGGYQSNVAPGTCDGDCHWNPKFPAAGPDHVVIEIFGKHSVSNPTRPDGYWIYLYKDAYGGGSLFTCSWIGNANARCLDLPIRISLNRTKLDATAPVDQPAKGLQFSNYCDPYWFCFEEKYQFYVTAFYHHSEDMVPTNYTAAPPT